MLQGNQNPDQHITMLDAKTTLYKLITTTDPPGPAASPKVRAVRPHVITAYNAQAHATSKPENHFKRQLIHYKQEKPWEVETGKGEVPARGIIPAIDLFMLCKVA